MNVIIRRSLQSVLSLLITLTTVYVLSIRTNAHLDSVSNSNPSQESENRQISREAGVDDPLLQVPRNCEDAILYLDEALLAWLQARDTYIIVIARLGTGERSGRLNRQRLSGIEQFLTGRVPEVRYVTAEGSRVNGLGRVELYVSGRLLRTMPIRRNSEGYCMD